MSLKTKYKHIYFEDVSAQYHRRVTSTYACWNYSGTVLGCVEWRSGWRQYVFKPHRAEQLLFSAGCLDDIRDFIKQLMDAR